MCGTLSLVDSYYHHLCILFSGKSQRVPPSAPFEQVPFASLSWWPDPGVIHSAAGMPTQLEMAMDTMIRIFHRYSCKEGDRFKLNKGELKMLLQRELTEFLTCQKDPQLVDKIMQDLDANKDNEVDFNEFVVMVAALTVACNDYFVEQLKKKGK
ncbi:protein S100-Z [Mesocricetus auratus]|uniref:Protein S100-Z n=7 Tax=Muroidea TaxID=337687 RepID=A0A1U7Q6F1_MESAU|nr:protein S100-Z [Mesocricetus auratus]